MVAKTVKKTKRPFGPPLDSVSQERLAGVASRVKATTPLAKPVGLEKYRQHYGLSYDDLALLIGAADRGHAWNLCVGEQRPKFEFAQHMIEVLGHAVTLETLMDLGIRK